MTTMPLVGQHHPDYDAFARKWKRCRDAVAGEDAIKAAGTAYLPMLSGQDSSEYQSYLGRALFYGASERTVQGLVGAVMRRDPSFSEDIGPDLTILLDSIGFEDESVVQLFKQALEEVVTVGRCGVYLDSTSNGDNPDPYLTIYFAENILSWRYDVIGGRRQLSMVVLEEVVSRSTPDPFVDESVRQYRVLRVGPVIRMDDEADLPEELENISEDVFHVEVWESRMVPKTNSIGGRPEDMVQRWVRVEAFVPTQWGGRPLDYIPFVFVNPSGIGSRLEDPPILPLVNVNLSHYRTSADLEHGRHFTALPTAWAAGFDPKSTSMRIGSGIAWISELPDAKAGFLEFTGAGLGHLAAAMREKEAMMAVLGARLLEAQQKDPEAHQTVRLRQQGEQSALASIADAVGEAFSVLVRWIGEWVGKPLPAAEVKANKDFLPIGVDVALLQAMMQAMQAGAVSFDTWFYNLRRLDILPPGRTLEDELSLIQTNPTAAAGLAQLLGMAPNPLSRTEDDEGDEDEDEDEDED